MCTYVTTTVPGEAPTATTGSRPTAPSSTSTTPRTPAGPRAVRRRVGGRRPVAVELDAASARRLAEAILATLDHDEVAALGG